MRASPGRSLAVLTAAVVVSLAVAVPAQATGDYGPDTCLQGFVWREATASDHVCVSGSTRTQARADNAQAAVRRNPAGGPYGPDTCLSPYVWREAVAGDHVCVITGVRAWAAVDNAQAAKRRNSLNVWHTTYTIPPVCSGGVCHTTSTDDIPRFRISADHVNVGSVLVQLRKSGSNALRKSWTVKATTAGYTPGGRFDLKTGYFDCRGKLDSYFRIRDPASGRWSAPHYVSSVCSVL
jgi:hypothetical protein